MQSWEIRVGDATVYLDLGFQGGQSDCSIRSGVAFYSPLRQSEFVASGSSPAEEVQKRYLPASG